MSRQRHVIMQVVKRSGGTTHHVEFVMDDNFAERLKQLRSLVPPLNSLNKQRDLVIDKVRVRLPSAVWRYGSDIDSQRLRHAVEAIAAGTFSAGLSSAGVSMRNSASVGGDSSVRRANIGSGAVRRAGRLANSSCAARSRAAAPSPNTRIDIERTIAANRKRKPGSMDSSSALR